MATLKYYVENIAYTVLKNKISAPKFQRNFVWKKRARRDLVDSIKQGLPIGSFLLQRLSGDQYAIIDGRQRLSTILDYEEHRYLYVEDKDLTEEKIERLLLTVPKIKEAYDQYNDFARKSIIKIIKTFILKQLKTKDLNKIDVVYDICDLINNKFPQLTKDDRKILNCAVNNFYDDIWQILDINNIILPCIIFNENATDDEIVKTFVNLNQKGTKLSQYDLYSAKWQNDYIIVDDHEIIEKVISKYEDSLENNQNIETQGFNAEEIRTTKEINVFEYAYALSKLIGEKCNNEIYQIKEASEVDALGFSILASILNISSKNMVELSKKLLDSHINCAILKEKIISCTLSVQKNLSFYCTAPDQKLYYTHAFNQLVSYIVTVFKAKYEITSDGRIVDNAKSSKIKDFYKNLPMWYLYDNIRGYWAGSGDTKLDNLVLVEDIFQSRYFGKVSCDSFRSALLEWISEENEEKTSIVKPETKLFINYIIKRKCSEYHDSMDIEHIIPQARLEMLATRERNVVGISSPANLTLIPKFDNRAKRDKTYYELIESKDETALTYNKEYLIKYVYPEHFEVRFIESQSDFTVGNYNQFKKDRANTLINLFLNIYYAD